MADLRAQALAYIRSGQVRLRTVATPSGAGVATLIEAVVLGHTGRHTVVMDASQPPHLRWTCTCWRVTGCAHAAAVGLVTGHAHLAARDTSSTPVRRSS